MKKLIVSLKLKLAVGLVAAFALAANSFAQTIVPTPATPAQAPWDSMYRPAIYAKKVAEFNANPIKPDDIVFLGNSITMRCDWAKLFNDQRLKNRGISGDITFGVLDRLDEVIAGHPKKIFILIGINDVSRNIPDSVIELNHRRIIARIRAGSPSTQIYFNTLLPVNASFNKFKNHYGKDEHILAINKAIRKLKAKKVTIIDLYPNFLDADNHLKAEYTADGLHPNDLGYQEWVKVFAKGKYLSK